MSKILVCDECSNPMEYYNSHKELLDYEQVHNLDEYLYRPCRTFVTLTTAIPVQNRLHVYQL